MFRVTLYVIVIPIKVDVSFKLVLIVTLSLSILSTVKVTIVSPGLITLRLGIDLKLAYCSIGWWVGPSSPSPMESWVKI